MKYRWPFTFLEALALTFLSLSLPEAASAAVATVGTDGGCTHTDLASAVAAVEAQQGPHRIFVVRENFPSMADVTITQSMTIWGGLPTCTSPSPTAGHPVIVDRDSGYAIRIAPPNGAPRIHVVLRDLTVFGVVDQEGGGIEVIGNAEVTLDSMHVEDSTHAVGGGLKVVGDSVSVPRVTITTPPNKNSTFRQNRATNSGGAISCSGDSKVILERTFLSKNSSDGDGGAIHLNGCELKLGEAVDFRYNSSEGGGAAIAAIGGSEVRTTAETSLASTSDQASHGGFLWADGSAVWLTNALVSGGSGVENGGFFHLSGGSYLEMTSNIEGCTATLSGFCSAAANSSVSERGGAFLVEDSQLVLRNTDLTSNSAGADGGAIHMENSIVHLEGVRIANNSGPSIISVLGTDSTELSLRYVTLTSSGSSTFPILISNEGGSGPSVEIFSSILWEPESPVIFAALNGATAPEVHCALTSLSVPGDQVLVADPLFADPVNLDYSLSGGSPAIDFCDDSHASTTFPDFELELRGTDQPGVTDRIPGNHFDLGFDERFGAVAGIFSDGFESGDTSAWSLATP